MTVPSFLHRDSITPEGRMWIFWVGFALFVGTAWVLLIAANVVDSVLVRNLRVGWDNVALLQWLGAICGAGGQLPNLGQLVAMWALMAVAMMGPTALPFIVTYTDIARNASEENSRRALLALVGGYFTIWLGFALVAASLQIWLQSELLVDRDGMLDSPWLVAGLLAVSAVYQLSNWKQACLTKCRNPLMFFLGRWRDGVAGAFGMGLRQGAVCVGCCWALMLLVFVGGTMNVLWMAGATVLMLAEKLPDARDAVRLGLAALLAACALSVLVYASVTT